MEKRQRVTNSACIVCVFDWRLEQPLCTQSNSAEELVFGQQQLQTFRPFADHRLQGAGSFPPHRASGVNCGSRQRWTRAVTAARVSPAIKVDTRVSLKATTRPREMHDMQRYGHILFFFFGGGGGGLIKKKEKNYTRRSVLISLTLNKLAF